MVTKENISQLMDDELEGADAARALSALRDEAEGRQSWRTYHLIGDALRDTRMLSQGFSERMGHVLPTIPPTAPAAARPPARPCDAISCRRGRPGRRWFRRSVLFWYRCRAFARAPTGRAGPSIAGPPLCGGGRTCPRAPAAGDDDYLLAHQSYRRQCAAGRSPLRADGFGKP